MYEAQRDLVRNVQRVWIVSALATLVCEHGPEGLSVRQIAECAGVSRRRFYELFASCDDCLAAAFDEAVVEVAERATIGYRSGNSWAERLRGSLLEMLAFFDAQPGLAKLLLLHTTPTGPAAARRNDLLVRLATFVERGGREAGTALDVSGLTAETVVGGVVGVVQGRLLRDDPRPLTDLVNPLMSVIIGAYLGPVAAWNELSAPVGQPAIGQTAAKSAATARVETRLTYRTLRVLAAIAATPGINNHAVARSAGVRDQGQISKLLARVERRGLIRNTASAGPKTARNAWVVTSDGAEIARDIGQRLHYGRSSPRGGLPGS
jgi:AcrR family transcriptional regulator